MTDVLKPSISHGETSCLETAESFPADEAVIAEAGGCLIAKGPTEENRYRKRKRLRPAAVLKYLSLVAACAALASLVAIVLFIFVNGIPNLSLHFIFGKNSYFDITISGVLVTTLKLVVTTVLIATPLGVLTAVYLSEYTRRGSRLVKAVRIAVETLAGVPSIVFGLFGMLVFVEGMRMGKGVYAGALTLSLMVLPSVVSTVEEALRSVPDALREGSFGLGAGRNRTTFSVVLPAALPGVLSAVILSMGRVISESACVMFTAGNSYNMGASFGSEGATLAVAMYMLASEGYTGQAYAIGVILIVLVAALNLAATVIAKRLKKRTG